MDQATRTTERKVLRDPTDVEALRALLRAKSRLGQERDAWRVAARLARTSDEVEDWRLLRPPVRAPRAPDRVTCVETHWPLLGVDRIQTVHHQRDGLVATALDGVRRWAVPTDVRDPRMICRAGPDWLLCELHQLTLVDRDGQIVARAPLGASTELCHGAAVCGDRVVVWGIHGHETTRFVFDVGGDRFGQLLAHQTAGGGEVNPDGSRRWNVAAGLLVVRAGDGDCHVRLSRVDSPPHWEQKPLWEVGCADAPAAVDERGVLLKECGLAERDLRSGGLLWRANFPWPQDFVDFAMTPARVFALGRGGRSYRQLHAWDRRDGSTISTGWDAGGEVVRYWPVGADLVVWGQARPRNHEAPRSAWLAVLDQETGSERWRLDLTPHIGPWSTQIPLPVDLQVADGVLALTVQRHCEPGTRQLVVSDSSLTDLELRRRRAEVLRRVVELKDAIVAFAPELSEAGQLEAIFREATRVD